MKNTVLIHEATREYVYPIERNCIEIKLISSRSNAISCRLAYWNRLKKGDQIVKTIDMVCYARDNRFNYYTCRILEDEAVKYIRYYFEIGKNEAIGYLNMYGISKDKPQEGLFEYMYTNENDIYRIPEWTKNAIIYQIFPERFFNGDQSNDPAGVEPWNAKPTRENFFGGDLRGIISKLDYLRQLDVTAIYFTPIFNAPSNHKYDTQDYYKIDTSFGCMEDFKELVRKCHDREIKVILDGVFNHCGYDFAPFQDVIKNGHKSKYKDWFYIQSYPVKTDPPNYECVGYYKWMPKLRFNNPEVRNYFLDVGAYWLEQADIDGWRLDVCDEIDYTFWQEFRKKIKTINQDAVLLGETWKDGRDLLRGDQMDSVMNYLFRDAVVAFIAKETIEAHEFNNRIQKMRSIYSSTALEGLYNLIGSHDTDRFLTLCNGDVRKLKLAVGLQLTFPGMPVIYYGDEIGMQGENDPDCRRPMSWDNINEELLKFYQDMAHIRKDNSCLIHGDYSVIACDAGLYGFARRMGDEAVYVVVNNSQHVRCCSIPVFEKHAQGYASLLNAKTYGWEPLNDDVEIFNADINTYSGSLIRCRCFRSFPKR